MKKHYLIFPLILFSLLLGIWTGWQRIGWVLPISPYNGEHGSLMVGSFLGTLICLERTITNKNKLYLLLPLFSSLSVIFFILQMPHVSYWILMLSGLGLSYVYLMLYYKFNETFSIIMLCGSLCWSIGNVVLLKTSFYPQAVMWWFAFLFFTIIAERLELSRYLNISKLRIILLLVLLSVYIIAILIPFHDFGGYIAAISFVGSAIWLFTNDISTKSITIAGQHRYSGILLLTGYLWLGISGIFMAYGSYWGLLYDATLHSFFLGFVFSMIFAHAPIILPGVLGIPIKPFNKFLYVWFILLQLSVIMRVSSVFISDILIKQTGGLLNGIAILGFLLNMIVLTIHLTGKRGLSKH